MNRVVFCLLATVFLGSGQVAQAQRHGRFFHQFYVPASPAIPEVQQVQSPAPTPPAPPPPATVAQVTPPEVAQAPVQNPVSPPRITPVPANTPATGVSCCDGTNGKCSPACKAGVNVPDVKGNCPPGKPHCEEIPVVITPGIETVTTDEKFYVKCDDYEAKVPIPVLETRTTEQCDFKKYTYTVECCTITVCVPCQKCTTTYKNCTLKPSEKPYKIRICERRNGKVDVYVLSVPGMPEQWMLYLEADLATVKRDLNIP